MLRGNWSSSNKSARVPCGVDVHVESSLSVSRAWSIKGSNLERIRSSSLSSAGGMNQSFGVISEYQNLRISFMAGS